MQSDNTYIESFIDIILNSISEYEASLLSVRVKEGNRACIQKGWWAGGRIPTGYFRKCVERSKDGSVLHSTLVKSEFESFYVDNIFKLYQTGYSYSQIAELLNSEHGFRRWTKSKINGIINNKTYTGRIYYQRRGGRRKGFKKCEESICSPDIENGKIIDEDAWDVCNEIKKIRSETKDAYYYLTPFVLKDKLFCANCESEMKPKNPGKDKSNVYKCTCSNEDKNHRNSIPVRKVHHMFAKTIQEEFASQNYDVLWDKYDEEFELRKSQYDIFIEEIAKKIQDEMNFTDELANQIKREKNKLILEALENQLKINMKVLTEYKRIQDEWIKRSPVRIEKDKFNQAIHNILVDLFDNFDVEDMQLDNKVQKFSLYKVREFIINFIDKVDIEFENRTIKYMKIEYKVNTFF